MRSEEEANRAVERYADTVRRICMVHLKNYADTEDIFQTVFLKYVLYPGAFDSEEHAIQATYEGKLEAIVQEAIDEYTAGEHTSENRTRIVYSKYDALTKLEQECDQKVADVVSRMRELLKATGQSESLADEVQRTYEEEKSLKKAYYIREFQEG